MKLKFWGLAAALVMIWGCSMKPTDNPVTPEETLKPCPGSPNCVSTLAHDPRHAMPPLPFIGTKDQSKRKLIEIIQSLGRSEIMKISDS